MAPNRTFPRRTPPKGVRPLCAPARWPAPAKDGAVPPTGAPQALPNTPHR